MNALQRFNYEYRYDYPISIFFLNLTVGLGKLLLIVGILSAAWFGLRGYLSPNTASEQNDPKLLNSSVAPQSMESELVGLVDASVKPNRKPTDSNGIHWVNHEWIFTQNPGDYIVQFGSSTDLDQLKEFAPAINTGEPIALFQFKKTRAGTPMYGVATNTFASFNAALGYIQSLGGDVKALEPWIRSISTLQQDIATALGAQQ